MEENIATRLKLFIDTSGLTPSQFADMCKIARPTLSQLLSGRNKKVSDVLISQIHAAFPELSVMWLLFGEGPVKVTADSPGLSQDSQGVASWAGGYSNSAAASNGSALGSGDDLAENGVVSEKGVFPEGEMRVENSPIPPYGRHQYEYRKENGLNSAQNGGNYSQNERFEANMRMVDLQNQIDNLRQNPRKVVQITIYYDDSTFETFVPKH